MIAVCLPVLVRVLAAVVHAVLVLLCLFGNSGTGSMDCCDHHRPQAHFSNPRYPPPPPSDNLLLWESKPLYQENLECRRTDWHVIWLIAVSLEPVHISSPVWLDWITGISLQLNIFPDTMPHLHCQGTATLCIHHNSHVFLIPCSHIKSAAVVKAPIESIKSASRSCLPDITHFIFILLLISACLLTLRFFMLYNLWGGWTPWHVCDEGINNSVVI